MSLTSRTVKGFVWLFAGRVAKDSLQLIVVFVLARLLTPLEFGVVGAAMVVISFSQIFSALGVGPAIVQRVDLSIIHIRSAFTISIVLGIAVSATIFAGSSLFASLFRMPDLQPVIQMLSLVFPIVGLSIVAEGLLQREMQFGKITVIRLISYIGYGVTGIWLAFTGWGVWSLVFGQLAQAVIYTVILLLVKRKAVGMSVSYTEMKHLLSFGAGLSLVQLGNYFARQIDNFVVGRWLGAEALGAYGRAYQIQMAPSGLIGGAIDQALFPAMALAQGDKKKLAYAYVRALAVIAMFMLPLGSILLVLAPEIVLLLLGQQWQDVILPFQVMSVFLLFRTSYRMSDSLVRATGAVYRSAWRQWLYAALVMIGAWTGHFWGLGGVALGVGLAVFLHFIFMLQLSISIIDLQWKLLGYVYLRHLTVALIIGGLTFVFASLGRWYEFHMVIILAGGIFTALLSLLLIIFLNSQVFGEEGVWIGSLARDYLQIAVKYLPTIKS